MTKTKYGDKTAKELDNYMKNYKIPHIFYICVYFTSYSIFCWHCCVEKTRGTT